MTALYFKSRKNFNDKSTWSKEQLPSDYTTEEVKQAAHLAGCEGYAIVSNFAQPNQQILTFKWFV